MHASTPTPLSFNQTRKAQDTYVTRNIRLDRDADMVLSIIQDKMKGQSPKDRVSVALVFRRSLKIYSQFLQQISDDPQKMRVEHEEIRKNSVIFG